MNKIVPDKLKQGDEVRIIAPSRSLAIIGPETRQTAEKRLADIGLTVSFGTYVEEKDSFASSSIKSRIRDLHEAFSDKKIKAILTVIGGFNSNQILDYIDWEIINDNPKIFCGFSDITALNNAIYAKTGLVNYSGPHYSTFGQKLHFEYTLEYFKKCLFSAETFEIKPSGHWSDDAWYEDQNNRKLIQNAGWIVINEGEADGSILGGNLCTFNLLQGTEHFPDISDSILFIEDDSESKPHTFDRDLQSLIHQKNFRMVKGLVIGRFQKESEMTNELLKAIIESKKELRNIPVIANVDFGHTDPKITYPIGGMVEIKAEKSSSSIKIIQH